MEDDFIIDLILPSHNISKSQNKIQVIGVGGGGSNIASYMYQRPMPTIDFGICNTDSQELCQSPIPIRVQLGTSGLGANNDPQQAHCLATESLSSIRQLLTNSSELCFITAGLGGATGTGAAPIIAHTARQKGLLTIALVTLPFRYEQTFVIDCALAGIEKLAQAVDALIIINNESLNQLYPEATLSQALEKANETMTNAIQTLVNVSQMQGIINSDFEDIKNVLRNGGLSIITGAKSRGNQRITQAIEQALLSPLVEHVNIYDAKKVLCLLSFPETEGELTIKEIQEIQTFTESFKDKLNTQVKLSLYPTPHLHDEIQISLIASGFGIDLIPGMHERHSAQEAQKAQQRLAQATELHRRRSYFYGEHAFPPITTAHTRSIHLFTPTDLDNENLVQWVETTPTCQRKK